MPRSDKSRFAPKILTAHHLIDGDVVYMDACGNWTRRIAQARLISDQIEAEALLKTAEADSGNVISAALSDALPGVDGTPQPTHFREVFRMTGPSNRFHGKQADFSLEAR